MSIKLLALDLDGTIVAGSHIISPRVQAAVKATTGRGVRVAIATGRVYETTEKFVRLLDLTTPTICCQGARIYDQVTGQIIASQSLSLPLTHQLIDLARSHRLALNLYIDGRGYAEQVTAQSRANFTKSGATLVEVNDLKQALITPPIKGLIIHPPEGLETVAAQLQAALGETVTIVRSSDHMIEAIPPGVSKGQALARLADYYGVAQSEVMAIGDHDNDVEMIAWAGLGIAMGNASPAAKAVADHIAPPLAEDGAAWAIEHFILREV